MKAQENVIIFFQIIFVSYSWHGTRNHEVRQLSFPEKNDIIDQADEDARIESISIIPAFMTLSRAVP